MPSMLLVRMAGAVVDVPPRWLLAAASAVCDPGDATPGADNGSFSAGALAPGGDAGTSSWRLGWLDDDATPPAWPPSVVRFGSRAVPVVGADLHRHAYAELAQSRPVRRVRLTMNTPTFFSRDGRDLPLPDPALALGGLVARWNRYAPGHLRIGADEARDLGGAVYLDAMWGSSAEVELGHGLRQVGFVGQADLRLVAAASDYTATMFTALARFAAFAGVGERTAHGFGAVDVDVADLVRLASRPDPLAVPTTRRADRVPVPMPTARTTSR